MYAYSIVDIFRFVLALYPSSLCPHSSLIHIHIHLVFLHMHARFILIPRNGPMDIASIFICLVIY